MALATRMARPLEGQVGNRAKRVSHRLPPSLSADLRATGHRPVTRARREESRRAAEIGEACERAGEEVIGGLWAPRSYELWDGCRAMRSLRPSAVIRAFRQIVQA